MFQLKRFNLVCIDILPFLAEKNNCRLMLSVG
jgi:hypothetical protein